MMIPESKRYLILQYNVIDFAKAFGVSATVMTLEEYKNFFGHELKW